jgi:protein required for attachment to host cells
MQGMPAGTLVVVADPRLLGLMRESLRSALHPSVQLRELARDYTSFTAADLQQQLVSSNMLAA